jgi:DNA 3'-phosphatase
MMRFLSSNKRTHEEAAASFVGSVMNQREIVPSRTQVDSIDDSTREYKARKSMFPVTNLLTAEEIVHSAKIIEGEWFVYKTMMYKIHPRSGVAYNQMTAFDLDGTLIKTKSGATFGNDWMFFLPNIAKVLLKEYERGDTYLAIISNQKGVKAGKTTIKEIQDKVDDIILKLGFPIDFICSFEDDRFRKPRTGMWEFLMNCRCPSLSPSSCVYVGDAAGRDKEGVRKKDFSDTDLKLAANLSINV